MREVIKCVLLMALAAFAGVCLDTNLISAADITANVVIDTGTDIQTIPDSIPGTNVNVLPGSTANITSGQDIQVTPNNITGNIPVTSPAVDPDAAPVQPLDPDAVSDNITNVINGNLAVSSDALPAMPETEAVPPDVLLALLQAANADNSANTDSNANKKPYVKRNYRTKYKEGEYPEEDIYLLAQLIFNESANQPYNGKVGIAEVVLNRLNNALFPGTVEEVIYSPGQFSNSRAIKRRKPTDEMIAIARGVLNEGQKVFNRKDVLYFRNTHTSDKIAKAKKANWGDKTYYDHIGNHTFYIGQFKEYEEEEKDTDSINTDKNETVTYRYSSGKTDNTTTKADNNEQNAALEKAESNVQKSNTANEIEQWARVVAGIIRKIKSNR